MQKTNRTKKATRRYRKNPKQKHRFKSLRYFKAGQENHTSRQGFGFYPVVPKGFYSIDREFTSDHDFEFICEVLKPSYLNYCKVSKVDPIEFKEATANDLRRMTDHLTSILKSQYAEASLRIQQADTGYQYEVYSDIRAHRGDNVFIFSIIFFERINFMSKYFSMVYEKFMAAMCKKMQIDYYIDNHRFDMLLHEINQRENYEDGEEGEMQFNSDMACYFKFAPIYVKRMRRVGDQFGNKSFKKDIEDLKTHGYSELKDLREWMIAGFDILSDKECQDINSFQYDNQICEEYNDDDSPENAVKLSDTFVFAWDASDNLSYQYLDWLNGDSGEYGSYTACEWMILTPNTNKIYKHSEWGERFFTWLNNGFKIFNQLETKQ